MAKCSPGSNAFQRGEARGNLNLRPSPPWGRGWRATGAFISRGETGEGVNAVKALRPYRKIRSLGRTVGQIDKARELRRTPTESEPAAWRLFRSLKRDSAWCSQYRRRLIEQFRIVTPSPGPPPLMKARVAGHPLPQGGEG